MNYRSFIDLSKLINAKLPYLHKIQADLVVGVPRSGIIPAYLIGLRLNLKVTDLNGLLTNQQLLTGITRKAKSDFDSPWDAKKILIVDDSISSGRSLERIRNQLSPELGKKVEFLAVFSSRPKRNDVDHFLEFVPCPRAFEWNILHSRVVESSALDIDGVLCVDPTPEENDDGQEYLNFLLHAEPLHLPVNKVHSLVTSRLEKYRTQTEAWLKKHDILYENLVMLDLPSKQERLRQHKHGKHKAEAYKNRSLDLFIESDPRQAEEISRLTGKPVFCVETSEMLGVPTLLKVCKNPRSLFDDIKRSCRIYLPTRVSNGLARCYRSCKRLIKSQG